IGPEEAAKLFHWMRPDADAVLVGAVGVDKALVRLLDALTGRVIQPAVVGAADAALIGDAEEQAGPTVCAMGLDQSVAALAVSVEDEVFAEEADRHSGGRWELAAGGDGVPVAAHQVAAGAAGADAGQ